MMEHKNPLVVGSFVVLLAVVAVYTLGLPPRQTADFFGLCWCAAVHFVATRLLVYLWNPPQPPLLRLGGTVTAVLWWLAAQGVVLVFRLFSLPATAALCMIEVLLLLAAALVLLAFALCRRYGS